MQINIQIVTTENLGDLLSKKLLEEGHNIVSRTSSYSEAFNQYKKNLPDIVFVDIDITDTSNGIKFCRGIYNIDTNAQIIVLSEHLNISIKSELFEIGVEHWLDKPFQVTSVLGAIHSICSNYDLLKLRDERTFLDFNAVNNTTTLSKKEQVNQNIYSLREQIKANRQLSDESSYFDLTLDSSDEDILKRDIDADNTNTFTNIYNDFGISSNTSSAFKYERSENINHETDLRKTYLGLPVFIDKDNSQIEKENTYKSTLENETSIDEDITCDRSNTSSKKEQFLGFIKKLKK